MELFESCEALGLNIRMRSYESHRKQRRLRLQQLADFLKQHADSMASDIHQAMGKNLAEAKAEVLKSAAACEYALQFPLEEKLHDFLSLPEGYRFELEPYGNILAIMPWNFPLWQIMRVLPYALLTGNRILHKPAPEVWSFWQKWQKHFLEILGEDSYQTCFWTLDEITKKIPSCEVDAVTLTGSVKAGRQVYCLAAESMKKCVLELGGSDVFLIGTAKDPQAWIPQAVEARFINMGQSCIAAKRFLLPEEHLPTWLSGLKNFLEQHPVQVQLVHDKAWSIVRRQIQAAQEEGAQVVHRPQAGELPVVLLARGDEKFWREEEFFAPVFVVSSYTSISEALQKANNCELALGASLWGFAPDEQELLVRGLEAGLVCVNEKVQSHPAVPFGGRKLSGLGYELGALGFLEWARVKIVKQTL